MIANIANIGINAGKLARAARIQPWRSSLNVGNPGNVGNVGNAYLSGMAEGARSVTPLRLELMPKRLSGFTPSGSV